LTEPGRLFTFDDYYSSKITPFRFFVTHSAPAYVTEFSINEHLNVHLVRHYIVSFEMYERFVGKDSLCVNEKYVAHLMFDLEKVIEVVRIYYRGETNFAYGHTDIELTRFTTSVSSIHFLGYKDYESLFIKNAFIGDLYTIKDVELVIDSKTFSAEYRQYINQTFQMNVTAYNVESKDRALSTIFNITFADRNDMNTYFIGRLDYYYVGYSYGDPSFSEEISNYYMGPDLKFNLRLNSTSEYDKNIVMPNITDTEELSLIRELQTYDN